jgi:hypothetical protein
MVKANVVLVHSSLSFDPRTGKWRIVPAHNRQLTVTIEERRVPRTAPDIDRDFMGSRATRERELRRR